MKSASRIITGAALAVALLAVATLGQAATLTSQEQALIAAAKKEGAVTIINPLFSDRTSRRMGPAFVKRYGLGPDFKFNNLRKGTGATVSQVRQEIKAGELLFEEGEFGEVAYLVVSGEVEIFRSSGNQERVLATVGRGEIIGEMSLIDSQPRVASARALSDTQVSLISRQSLQQRLDRLEENDRVLRRLIGVLVDRVRGQASSPG